MSSKDPLAEMIGELIPIIFTGAVVLGQALPALLTKKPAERVAREQKAAKNIQKSIDSIQTAYNRSLEKLDAKNAQK